MDADWNCSFVEETPLNGCPPESVLAAELLKTIGIWYVISQLVNRHEQILTRQIQGEDTSLDQTGHRGYLL